MHTYIFKTLHWIQWCNFQLRTWKVSKLTTYQTERRLRGKAKISLSACGLPVVKKYSQKIGFWRNYIEFDIRMIVHTQAISPHSYLKPLWENILMRAHESQWEATLNCPWMGSVCKWGCQRLNEQRMRGMGAKVERALVILSSVLWPVTVSVTVT